jgi:4-amino-4-deoxy-L-arabinose transferase-like glycosyltransferase
LQPSTLAKRANLLLFLIIIAFFLYGIGRFPLIGPDEPRYAEVAREMLMRGDFITPTLGGRPWFEKPALLYWLMMASFKVFGVNEWAARFPSALSGVLTVAALFVAGRKVEQASDDEQLRGLGFWCGVAGATTLGIIVFSRAASFDILLTLTITWSLTFFLLHEIETQKPRRLLWLLGFFVFIGLSILAKGFIGAILPGGIALTFYLLERRIPSRDTLLSLVWGIPVALIVAATWYVPVIARHGSVFVDQFIWQHQFSRYLSNNYRHPGPFYYYLVMLAALSLPWIAFFIGGLARAASWVWRKEESTSNPVNKLLRLAFVWLVLPLLFFSFSRSKLPGYILPALPAVVLFVGERLARFRSDREHYGWKLRVTSLMFVFAATGVIYMMTRDETTFSGARGVAVIMFIAGGSIWYLAKHRAASLLMVAANTLTVVLVLLQYAVWHEADRNSSKRLLQLADDAGYSQTQIHGLKIDDRSPEFYAAGRVIYRPDGEPVMYDGAPQIMNETRARNTTLLAFVPLESLGYLVNAREVRTQVIGDNGIVALVAVSPTGK